MSLKVLQLSDLHFCVDELRGALHRLAETAGRVLLGELELSFANEEVLDSLKELIATENPDVLAVTGDITAFGDTASFQAASKWFDDLLSRWGGAKRPILFVPGHHDALRHCLSFLATRPSLRPLFHEPLDLVASYIDSEWKQDRFLESYRNFVRGRGGNSDPCMVPVDDNGYVQLCCFLFASLSNEPWWISGGASRKAHWQTLKRQMDDPKLKKPGTIRIVLMHHNPLNSPGGVNSQKSYAYRSMPGSMELLRAMQQHGIDLLLHGHEHAPSICSHDFEVSTEGHVYSVGCPSSSSHRGGVNILLVEEPNHVRLKSYMFDDVKEQFECHSSEGIELALERNRPPDSLTRNVRYEIKSYFYKNGTDEGEAWKPLQRNTGAKLIYMSGRKLAEVREARFEQLSTLLESRNGDEDGPRIRILLMDPKLAEMLANAVEGKLWGDAENLEKLAKEAQQTLDELMEYVSGLSKIDQERVEVRVSHTLLPFGAYVTDPDKPWGKMAVKLLPVGALGDLHSPIIRLNRRQDFTLYHFYLRHLKYLFLKGKAVLGSWRFGDEDLRKEMDFMIRQSR